MKLQQFPFANKVELLVNLFSPYFSTAFESVLWICSHPKSCSLVWHFPLAKMSSVALNFQVSNGLLSSWLRPFSGIVRYNYLVKSEFRKKKHRLNHYQSDSWDTRNNKDAYNQILASANQLSRISEQFIGFTVDRVTNKQRNRTAIPFTFINKGFIHIFCSTNS